MRLLKPCGLIPAKLSLILLSSCKAPTEASTPPTWKHLYLRAEAMPALPWACPADTSPWAISIELRRDPLTGQVEWLSGHRYALTLLLEQLPVRLLILERPWYDTAFFPAAETEAAQFWKEKLCEWLLGDLLPFLGPYPEVQYVAFGRGWTQAPLTAQEWTLLLDTLRAYDPNLRWGLASGTPDSLPALHTWDFLGIDYQHFYPKEGHRSYQVRWEATGKPFFLLYPNLFELDKEVALSARQKGWEQPPVALLAYQDSDTLPCP